MNQRSVILHYHIFKNAGTTLSNALAKNFGTKFAEFDSSHYDRRLWPHELISFLTDNPHLAAVSSHHLRPPAPSLPGTNIHELLLLRHPLDRIRSMCDFYRTADVNSDPLTELAKKLTIPEFLKFIIDNRPNLIADAQVNLVANGGAAIPNDEDLDRATRIINKMCGIGVVEEMDLFALTTETRLRRIFSRLDLSHSRKNVSRGRARQLQPRLRRFSAICGEVIYEELISLNQRDLKLAELARTEARRRLQEIPSAEKQLKEFRLRVLRHELGSRVEKGCRHIERLWKWTSNHATRRRRVGAGDTP